MAAQNPDWLWNPYAALDLHTLLDIHPSGCILSCVGYAVSRDNDRCRKPISREKQLEACEMLDSMAVEVPSSPAVTRALSKLVRRLLCGIHRVRPEQKKARLSKWEAKIRDVSHGSARIRDIAVELNPGPGMLLQNQQLRADLRICQEAQRRLEEEQVAFQHSQTLMSSRIRRLERELDAGKTELQKVKTELQQVNPELQQVQTELQQVKTELQQVQRQIRDDDNIPQNHQPPATAQMFMFQGNSGTNPREIRRRRSRKEIRTPIEMNQSGGSSNMSELDTLPGEAEAHTPMISNTVSNLNTQLQIAGAISPTYEQTLNGFKAFVLYVFALCATNHGRILQHHIELE